MTLKEFKEWANGLPEEFNEYVVVNATIDTIDANDNITYRLDKPVTIVDVSEETKEILIFGK